MKPSDVQESKVSHGGGTAIAKKTSYETVHDLINKNTQGFAKALPSMIEPERFIRMSLTAIRKNPKLMNADSSSLMGALMLCAQTGLEPNTPLHHAALIPYGKEVEFQIEYRGYLQLAWNSGQIKMIDYGVIYTNDDYDYQKGLEPRLYHKPLLEGERGDPIMYYAMAELISGGKAFVVISHQDAMSHAKRFSKAYQRDIRSGKKNSPWSTDPESMGIKTALRELIDKKLPKSTDPQTAVMMKSAGLDSATAKVTDEDDVPDITFGYDTDEQIEDAEYEDEKHETKTVTREQAVEEKKPKKKQKKADDTTDYIAEASTLAANLLDAGGDPRSIIKQITGESNIVGNTPAKQQGEVLQSLADELKQYKSSTKNKKEGDL